MTRDGTTAALAAILRILREVDVYVGHYQPDGTAWVYIEGAATVTAEDARILESLTA